CSTACCAQSRNDGGCGPRKEEGRNRSRSRSRTSAIVAAPETLRRPVATAARPWLHDRSRKTDEQARILLRRTRRTPAAGLRYAGPARGGTRSREAAWGTAA